MKSIFLGKVELNTEVFSLLNILKNNVTTLVHAKGDMKLSFVVSWGFNGQRTEELLYRPFQSFYDTNK